MINYFQVNHCSDNSDESASANCKSELIEIY